MSSYSFSDLVAEKGLQSAFHIIALNDAGPLSPGPPRPVSVRLIVVFGRILAPGTGPATPSDVAELEEPVRNSRELRFPCLFPFKTELFVACELVRLNDRARLCDHEPAGTFSEFWLLPPSSRSTDSK